MKRVVVYLNQFFSQKGGEEQAHMKPDIVEEVLGPGVLINSQLHHANVVATAYCGDNYYAENIEDARKELVSLIERYKPDLVIAGPAFNAGRYGIACADLCHGVMNELGIPAITGMYLENPAVEIYRRELVIASVGKSAASMRDAISTMSKLANKILENKELGSPEEEGTIAMGKRVNVFKDKKAAVRAVEMLITKLKGGEYKSEVPIPFYDGVTPAPPIEKLALAKIALLTTGGIVPMGNPDHLPAATAKFYKNYPIDEIHTLREGAFESVHAGFDPVYCNENPNRVAPLDLLKESEQKGEIGSLYPYLVSTTGNSTSVADATRMGQEIAAELKAAGVDGAIMTST